MSSGVTVKILTAVSTGTPLTVQGAASQTADLAQWTTSTGTVLASIGASGYFNILDASGYSQNITTMLIAGAW